MSHMDHAMEMHGHDDMSGMAMHGMHAMRGLLGSYGMTREASGTSWQPEASPHEGLHRASGPWTLMLHGYATLVDSDQAGPAGGPRQTKIFSENMLMGMAARPLGPGELGLRAMFSAEPWTIGRSGYPLVLQTGETADGVTPLRDRQHPHDLFMELAATYSLPAGDHSSVFLYVGEPGEPALGPPAYMHRFSAMDNPETPISHHWLDSTHISYGVVTLGWIQGGLKLEGSAFNGHEPDPDRTDLDTPKLNSYSFRASYAPSPHWSLQTSFGHLDSPEQLEPGVDTNRTTASVMYDRPLSDGNWQSTVAWGRNDRNPGRATNAFLAESTVSFATRHTLFGRIEHEQNDELLGTGQVAAVAKLSLGGVEDVQLLEPLRGGVGLLGSISHVPLSLAARYGHTTLYSWMAFFRLKLAPPAGAMSGAMRMAR